MQANVATQIAVHFDALMNGSQEPQWLQEQRRTAWAAFESRELPFWRRTNLKGFNLEAFTPAKADVEIRWDGDTEGVVVLPLAEAIAKHPDLVQKALGSGIKSETDVFTALNNALVNDGVFVYVPKTVAVEAPIMVRYTVRNGGELLTVRTVALLERHSSATIIEEFVGEALETPTVVLSGTEFELGDEANVTFNSVQNLPDNAYVFGGQTLNLRGKDSHGDWVSIVLGAKTQHITMDAQMLGNGSNISWNGLIYGNNQQNLLVAPTLNHAGLNTEGQINFKTVVDGESYAVFDGMVRIPHTGQGTNSDLRENAMHLSRTSRSDSIPGLEIDANEVKAGHGATSGQIDEEQIFYLMSRGLPRSEAKRTIVLGFVGEIIDFLADDTLKEQVEAIVADKA